MALKRLLMILAISPKVFGRHRPLHTAKVSSFQLPPRYRQQKRAKAGAKSKGCSEEEAAQLTWQRKS